MAIPLTKELLTTEPENLAKEICENGKDTSTQIRKFYNDFLILKTKADVSASDEKNFRNNILPLICFSKAKIAYAMGRPDVKLSKSFANSINNKVDAIESREDFENFLNYYQALIGYVTYWTKIKEDERRSMPKNGNFPGQKYPNQNQSGSTGYNSTKQKN